MFKFMEEKKHLDKESNDRETVTAGMSKKNGKKSTSGAWLVVASGEKIKSLSDTAIYAPALNRRVNVLNNNCGQAVITDMLRQATIEQPVNNVELQDIVASPNIYQINDKVANFVDSVHAEQTVAEFNTPGLDAARKRSGDMVLEAEKFRAKLANPPGMKDIHYIQTTSQNRGNVGEVGFPDIGSGVSDDDFFHLTCHIDPSLIHKIEKGEFVELEKLLPKANMKAGNNENRLEWIQKDGGTFLVPANCNNNITSIRKWEQAFRAYATIYCGAYPHRSKEIWQYIAVINTTAAAYSWDNVYNYDLTFRHLMAFNPQRSWAVTYNQIWNLSMRDPLPKSFRGGFGGQSYG